MALYHVTYRNHLDADGNTFEFPTDKFESNGVEVIDFSFVEYGEPQSKHGNQYALETWEYEVDDEDAERFEEGLDQINTAKTWKRVN